MSCLRHECTQEQGCKFSLLSWEWLKQLFNRNLNFDVGDPEEIITRCSGRNGKAGLWLLLGVVHYNMKNNKAGSRSITENSDGYREIIERLGGSVKTRSRKYSKTLCTVFESPESFVLYCFFFLSFMG
jgi:hypothetical protein